VSEGGTVSDKEKADEDIHEPSQLEVMSVIQTIRNYVSTATASSSDTVCKLEKQTEDIHRHKKSKQCKMPGYSERL
jgi:hypothetical protein